MRSSSKLVILSLSLLALFAGCGGDPQTGPQGPAGPQGTPGPGGDASISGVAPRSVFAERTVDVTLSGYSTTWTDAAELDFGAGINVANKIVASPTSIIATIEVTDAAALGLRDVTVKEGSSTVTYKGAFEIKSPLEIALLQGSLAQGSIFLAKVAQKDLSTPFDATSVGDGFFTPLVYTNFGLALPDGIGWNVSTVGLFDAEVVVLADVNVATGPVNVTVNSGPKGETIASTAKDAFSLEARAPIALTKGVAAKAFIKGPFDTLLYSFTPSAKGTVLSFETTASLPMGSPAVAVLPASGSFNDTIVFDPAPKIPSTESIYYLVVWDNSGASGYEASLKVTEQPSDEVEPNETCATAQSIAALPASLQNISLSSDKDVDWFKISATAAEVGKVIHVTTSPGDEGTDTLVDVIASDCTTSLGGPSSDADVHEDFTSTPIPAGGDYYVTVSHSPFPYAGAFYNLSITIE